MLYGHLDTRRARVDGRTLRAAHRGRPAVRAGRVRPEGRPRRRARRSPRGGPRGRSGPRARRRRGGRGDHQHGHLEVLRHVRADGAVITEPTELAVGIAHRGFVWVEIEVRGKAAHGSRPHLGVDAIFRTGPVIAALERYTEGLAGRTHPLLGAGCSTRRASRAAPRWPPCGPLPALGRAAHAARRDPQGVLAEIEAILDACRARPIPRSTPPRG